MRSQVIVWGLLLVILASPLSAAVINVPAESSTIQAALDGATNGDSIIVAAGSYSENLSFLGKAVVLRSSAGAAATTITPATTTIPIVRFEGGEDTLSILDGFTLSGTTTASGIRINGASPVVRNCVITSCVSSGSGAGISIVSGAGRILDNDIFGNQAGGFGGGIHCSQAGTQTCVIRGNSIHDNNSTNQGCGISLSQVENYIVSHNLIYANSSSGTDIAGIWLRGNDIQATNNTIVDNPAGLTVTAATNLTIRNNLVAFNAGVGIEPVGDYNLVWSNGTDGDPGPNGLNADPLLADYMNGDLQLLPGSTCIDAGDPDPAYNDSDLTRNDIGALPATTYPIAVPITFGAPAVGNVVFSATPEVNWDYFDTLVSSQAQ